MNDSPINECRHQGLGIIVASEGLGDGNDIDDAATASHTKVHGARGECEKSVIATTAHIRTWVEVGTTLTNDDFAGINQLATETLDSESL
jgi:hypothetical protein